MPLRLVSAKKSGELIKILLAPPLVRMVMATCAIHSHAKKDLAEQRGQSRRFAAGPIDHRWADPVRTSLGGQNLTSHLVVWFIGPPYV
mgnify:CR=1 FL=1